MELKHPIIIVILSVSRHHFIIREGSPRVELQSRFLIRRQKLQPRTFLWRLMLRALYEVEPFDHWKGNVYSKMEQVGLGIVSLFSCL